MRFDLRDVDIFHHAHAYGRIAHAHHVRVRIRFCACGFEPDAENRETAHTVPQRLCSLPRRHSPAGLRKQARNHYRDKLSALVAHLVYRIKRSLHVQGVFHTVEKQYIGAAVQQATHLFPKGIHQFTKTVCTFLAGGTRYSAYAAGNKLPFDNLPELSRTEIADIIVVFRKRLAGNRCARLRDIVRHVLQAVRSLPERSRIAGVRADNVCTRLQVRAVHLLYAVRRSNAEDGVIPQQVYGMVGEHLATKIFLLGHLERQLRAEIPVHDENAAIARARQILVGLRKIHVNLPLPCVRDLTGKQLPWARTLRVPPPEIGIVLLNLRLLHLGLYLHQVGLPVLHRVVKFPAGL